MKRELTEKQQKFLDVLFDEAQGDFGKAKRLAGYSETVSPISVVSALQEEIAEKTKTFLATRGPSAAWAMTQILENPTDLGNKEKMAAAKDLLDRAGHKAGEKIEVKADTPLFILPQKQD